MAARLVAVVVLEACLCAFFGWQLAEAAEPMPAMPSGAATSPSPTAPAAPASAPLAAHDSKGDPTTAAAPTERTTVRRTWDANDPIGVLLTGTVRWSDGGTVADPRLYAKKDDGGRGAASSGDGSFVFVGLSPGEWSVSITTEGAEVTQTITITDDAEQQHDFVLDRTFPIRVFAVTPDGKDLQKAAWAAKVNLSHLNVVGQTERLPERLAPTDYGVAYAGDAKLDGETNSKDGFLGTLHLKAPPPAHAGLLQRHVVLQQQRIEAGQSEVKFVVDVETLKALIATVSLRVIDEASGTPIAGLRVGLDTSSGAVVGGPKTDAEGRISLDTSEPGLLFLNIRDKDHESYWSTIRVEPGEKVDLGDVRLGAMQALKGRLFDKDGKPGGGDIGWTELKWRSAPRAFSHNRGVRMEADGSFELFGTGRGPIAVQARGRDGTIAMGVFDNPTPAPIELRLVPAATCKVVRNADPTKAYTVTFFDAKDRPLYAKWIGTQAWDREFAMLPGTWRFEVHEETDRLVQSGTLTFGASPTTLEIR